MTLCLLADRASAATFPVPCGSVTALNAAIASANATTTADTITITGGPCTFSITSPAVIGGGGNNTGLTPITQPLTIQGNGATIARAAGSLLEFRLLLANGVLAQLDIRDLTISGGRLSAGNVGAGVALFGGATAAFDNVTLANNQVSGTSSGGVAASGAALWTAGGSFTFDHGVIISNQAPVAAAFSMTQTQGVIRRSLIAFNGATSSAGVGWVQGGSLILENVTVAGNHAPNSIGGIVVSNSGAITGTATISFSTFLDNGRTGITAPGGALYQFVQPGGGQAIVQLAHSIIADTDSSAPATLAPCTGVTSTGTNIEWPTNTCHATVVNPMLVAPVGGASGAASAWRPLPGSSAIDAGGDVCPETDQRGVARPDGEACDIGAYETPAPQTVASGPTEPTMSPQITFSSPDTASATFQCRVDGGSFFACTSPFAPIVSIGTHTVMVRAMAAGGYPDASPASVTFVKQDTVPPVVNCSAPAAGGWNTGDVTVTCTATDAHTGLQNPGEGSFTLTTSGDGAAVSTGTRTIADAAGNVTIAGPYGPYMVDKGVPVVSCQAPSSSSPSKTDIVVTCTSSDQVSGLANAADGSFTLTTSGEGPVSTGTRTVVDIAGNSTTVGPFGPYVVDKTAPSISCSAPAPDGWRTADIAIACTASDGGAGLADAADASFTLTTTGEGDALLSSSRTVTDAAGNFAAAGPFGPYKIDKTAPVLNCTPPADGVWYRSDVAIACTAVDSGAGLASAADASFTLTTTGEGGALQTSMRSVTDAAGNTATAGPFGPFKVDKTAPLVTCAPAPTGVWYRTDVGVVCTATDGGAGLANAADGSFTLATTGEGAAIATVARTIADAAGNIAPAGPFGPYMVDKTAPIVSAPAALTATATSASGAVIADSALGSAAASDASAVTVTRTGVPAGNLFPVGTTLLTYIATDAAGNTASATQSVTVSAPQSAVQVLVSQVADFVNGLSLDAAVKAALLNALAQVPASIEDLTPSQRGQLGAFVNKLAADVHQLKAKKVITAQQDAVLTALLKNLGDAIKH